MVYYTLDSMTSMFIPSFASNVCCDVTVILTITQQISSFSILHVTFNYKCMHFLALIIVTNSCVG